MKPNDQPLPNVEELTTALPRTLMTQMTADSVAPDNEATNALPVTEPVPLLFPTESLPAAPQASVFAAPPDVEMPAVAVQRVITTPRPRSPVPRLATILAGAALLFTVLTLVLLLSARDEGKATTDRLQDDTTVSTSAAPSSTSTARTVAVASSAAATEPTEPTETIAPSTAPPRSAIVATSTATTSAPSTVTRTTLLQAPTTTVARGTSTTSGPTTTASPSTTAPTPTSSLST